MWSGENVNSRRIEHAVMDCPQWTIVVCVYILHFYDISALVVYWSSVSISSIFITQLLLLMVRVCDRVPVNHTSRIVEGTQWPWWIGRNRCVIEVSVFVLSLCELLVKGYRTESNFFPFPESWPVLIYTTTIFFISIFIHITKEYLYELQRVVRNWNNRKILNRNISL